MTIRTGFGPGGGGQFAIADTGPGIAAQARAGLFRPFFLSKLKGMGVSLPVLRRRIESHGHAIEAESGRAQARPSIPIAPIRIELRPA